MTIKGIVRAGRSLGRTLGFPTANIPLPPELNVSSGVYHSLITFNFQSYNSVSNVGTKPTVGGEPKALECHILDFEGDIYGCEVEVELLEKLRDEQQFDSLEKLREQIVLDIEQVKNLK